MPRVVHFEIPADNADRAAAFYKSVFGWEIKDAGMPMKYYLCTTGQQGTMGIDGAIMAKEGTTVGKEAPSNRSFVNTIDVPNLDEFVARIEKAGGKQVTKKNAIPGIGDFCYCQDTEGNLFGILQPVMG
jgi:predicted enzyme related to lactoylglutathione lyase